MLSTHLWYHYIQENLTKEEFSEKLYSALEIEIPTHLSVIFERTCNLQCRHCIYLPEKSSDQSSFEHRFSEVVSHMVKQAPQGSTFLHEGRILRKSHLDVLWKVKELRPDIKMGLIDNGTYVSLADKLQGFFDWLDLSFEGLEETHNAQRDPVHKRSFRQTIQGLDKAREVLKKGGRLSCLTTLTRLNYKDILSLSDFLIDRVDELHFTPVTPTRASIQEIEMGFDEFSEAWKLLKETYTRYGEKIVLKFYRVEDLYNLLRIYGDAMRKSFLDARLANGVMYFVVDGVSIYYYPTSLWPTEGMLIDADACYRVAYSQQFTLDELHKGFRKYTVMQLTDMIDYVAAYHRCLEHWRKEFFIGFLEKEKKFFEEVFC